MNTLKREEHKFGTKLLKRQISSMVDCLRLFGMYVALQSGGFSQQKLDKNWGMEMTIAGGIMFRFPCVQARAREE